MNIVMGDQRAAELASKYTLLRLDTFISSDLGMPVTAYCVLENVPITEMTQIDNLRDLHEKLIFNYGKKNWNFCEQALEHLIGKWNCEVDSFYFDLSQRILQCKNNDPGPDWDPIIRK